MKSSPNSFTGSTMDKDKTLEVLLMASTFNFPTYLFVAFSSLLKRTITVAFSACFSLALFFSTTILAKDRATVRPNL